MTGPLPTVIARLDARAHATPTRPLFTFHGDGPAVAQDHGALVTRSNRLAHALRARGVGPGDRVALSLPTGPQLVSLIVACQRLAAVPVVLNPSVPEPTRRRRAATVAATLLVEAAAASALDQAADALPADLPRVADARPEHLAFMQLTSGTSGEPRAAALTHANVTASLTAAAAALGLSGADVLVAWVPLHHDLGLVRFALTPLFSGAHTHLLPPSLASLRPWLALIAATGATVTGAPDFAYRLAARTVAPLALPSLRLATNGGEPVRASTLTAFEARFGCPGAVRPGYGLAEATLGVAALRPGEPVAVDAAGHVGCGRLLPEVEARVMGPDGPLPAGQVGALEIRGPAVFAGYWDTARGACDRASFADGWHQTGDHGYLDARGELFVLGRARVMLKRGGALFAPRELEEPADLAGLAHGVRFSAAVSVPLGGELADAIVLVAEVRPAPPDAGPDAARAARAALSEAVRTAIGFAPHDVLLVPPGAVPLTANGKIRHAELARLVSAGAAPFDALRPR